MRAEHRADAIAAVVEPDIAVHRAVVATAHNRVLSELFETFVPRLTEALVERIELLGLRGTDKEPDSDEHLALVEAIAAGDEEAAVLVSRAHLGAMLAAVRTPG